MHVIEKARITNIRGNLTLGRIRFLFVNLSLCAQRTVMFCKVSMTIQIVGFRDVKEKLEDEKFKVLMSAPKDKREQLSTKESNESCFVAKVRWAVQSVHGALNQKHHQLDHKADNKLIPNNGIYF